MHAGQVASALRQRDEGVLVADVTEVDPDAGLAVQQLTKFRDGKTVAGVNTDHLRALLQELHAEVRPECRAAVRDELARLDATVAQSFGDSVDLDRATAADTQGIGGPRTRPAGHAPAR